MPDESPLRPAGEVLGAGALTGLLAGLATGLGDALWSWGAAAQFVPGTLDRLRHVLFAGISYAAAGLVLGVVSTVAGLLLARASRAGALRRWVVGGGTQPAPTPSRVPAVSLAIATAAGVAAAIVVAHRAITPFITHRKELALAAVVAIVAGVIVVLATTGVVLVAARALELPIAKLAKRERPPLPAPIARDRRTTSRALGFVMLAVPAIGGALAIAYRIVLPSVVARGGKDLGPVVLLALAASAGALALGIGIALAGSRLLAPTLARRALAPWAPGVAAALLIALGALGWLAWSWETARLLPLRIPAVLAVAAILVVAGRGPATALGTRLRARAVVVRRASWIALPPALLGLLLAIGSSDGVIKASSAYTAFGGPIARAVRTPFDFDRDGYSRFLGGGDCDDSDRTVHPGAPEIPDDGIDQNCVGGDPSAKQPTPDVGFAAVPTGLPADFRVLLITIDTVRADHFGMYGYHRGTSPNLDALAGQGTVFEHGWAHAPSTRYSIPAILTGRLPLDVYYDTSIAGWPGLSPKATTIAEALQPLGFHGGAITNYDYFHKSRRMDQGIAEYDNTNARLHGGVAGAGPEQTKGSSSKEQTDKAIAFVDRNADQRWFLWVHYYDPHYAYEPHADAPSFGSDEIALYDGEIAFTDRHIGRLLDHLKQTGMYDKTVIVVTGDHGEGFGEHGIKLHGYHLYAAQTKVPFVIRVPGVPPRRAATPAGHVDLLPTLVNLAGGAPSPDMMGRSLVDAITGTDRERVVFQQLSYENNHEMRAAIDARCHVIYNVSPSTSWEVYRLDRDPLEVDDVSGGDECRDTRDALERWYDQSQIPPGAAEALLPGRPQLATTIDADLGEGVRLLACEAPATVKPGDPVTLTWFFEARGEVAPGWKMFVHVLAPNRASFLNGDHVPARPFEWWKPGQFLRYTTTVTVPRGAVKGRYVVHAGMFKGATRAPARAKVPVHDNAVACTSFEVAP